MAEQVVAEYKLQVDGAVKSLDKLQSELKQTDTQLKKVGKDGSKAIESVGKETSALTSGLKKLGSALIAAFAVDRIISVGKEMVKLAAQAEGVERAFKRIGSPQLLADLRKATRGTVSDLQLMQNAVKASNFKIPLENLAALFKFAQARARETGESVDYLVDSIILGIGRKSPLILDNLGISAVELRTRLKGVGVEAANVGDIAQIIGDIATEELAKMGDQADTTADKLGKLNATWLNMKKTGGELLILLFDDIDKFLDSIKFKSKELQQENALAGAFKEGSIAAAKTVENIKKLELTEDQRKRMVERNVAYYEKAYDQEQENIQKLVTELESLEGQTSTNARKRRTAILDELASLDVLSEGYLAQIDVFAKYLDLLEQGEGETDNYVRSINQLNAELKDIQSSLKDAEIGSKEWIDIIEQMFNKTEELNDANEELAWRLAVLEGAFSDYESIDTKGIDDFTGSVEKASAALKKAREEAQKKSLQLTGDEFIDPSLGFQGISAADIINTQSDQATFDESLQQWSSYASSVSAIGDSISQIQAAFNQQELDALNYQLQQGEITRDEYDKRRREIMEQQAEDRKDAAIFDATVSGFSAVVQAYNTDPTGILAGITAAIVAAQIAAISATPIPQYAKGVIDFKGKGTKTSDSNLVRISHGESVMTGDETVKYNEELWAMRRGTFEDLILTKYVKPMIDESLFKGFADLGRSAQLNGITVNMKDHNILHGLDRLRQSQDRGFQFLAKEFKLSKQSRGGYRA